MASTGVDKKSHYDASHVEDVQGDSHRSPDIDINRNINAIIQNPLGVLSKDELMHDVTHFCVEFGLEHKLETFQKGALIAQNPNAFEGIEELTDVDKYHLRREITHKWHLPKDLYFTLAVCSLGSAIQGWDNTGANGANLSFPKEFGIKQNTWLVGFINSAPTIFGLFSAWLADPLNDKLGRRGVIFLTGLFCVFPVLGQGFTHSWWELLICRLIMGIGMGIKITTIPIMTSETVPTSIRGGLVMSFQLYVAFGILLGFSSNLIFYDIGPLAWRFQLAAAFAPAIPILIFIWMCPESSRWLLKKNRYQEAFRSFCRLRNSEVIAARDMYYAHCQLIQEASFLKTTSLRTRFLELATIPRVRRATIAGWIAMAAQQFSGINVIAFYSSSVFEDAGYNTKQSLLASFGFGLMNFVFAFPAVWTIDTFGRRNLLLFTFPNMAWCLIVTGFCFYIPAESSTKVPLIAFFIYLFTAFYSPGIGPVPNVYAAECFPLSHREIGAASSIFMNNLLSSILSLTFPSLISGIGPTGAFCFYAGLNMLAFVLIFLFLPETKQRSLEELDYVFGVPTRRHAAYQIRQYFPWWIQRYVLWKKDVDLAPLYNVQGFSAEN